MLFLGRLVRVPVDVVDISCLGVSTVSDGSEASEAACPLLLPQASAPPATL